MYWVLLLDKQMMYHLQILCHLCHVSERMVSCQTEAARGDGGESVKHPLLSAGRLRFYNQPLQPLPGPQIQAHIPQVHRHPGKKHKTPPNPDTRALSAVRKAQSRYQIPQLSPKEGCFLERLAFPIPRIKRHGHIGVTCISKCPSRKWKRKLYSSCCV